jgi:hypothetical protein
MRTIHPIVATVLVAVAVLAPGAAAAARANAAAPPLCVAAKGVAANLVQATNITSARALSPAQLKAAYSAIVHAEPTLLASSSGKIRTHLKLALAFVNLVDADFKQANWSVIALAPQLPTLVVAANKAQPHINAVKAYLNTTCHLHV